MKKGFIYLLESKNFKCRYLGSTNNPTRRISQHNNKKVGATKLKVPWNCILIINVGDLHEARKIEQYIKSHKERLTIENIIKILNRYYKHKNT